MTSIPEQISNFKSVFNHFVGYNTAGKAHTITSLSLVTGIPKPTIQNHLAASGSHPTWPMMILYMKVFDSSFTDALLSPAGLSVMRADEHDSPSSHKAMSCLAKTMHRLAVALEDEKIDDMEKKELSPTLRSTGQDLIALANSYDDALKGIKT